MKRLDMQLANPKRMARLSFDTEEMKNALFANCTLEKMLKLCIGLVVEEIRREN